MARSSSALLAAGCTRVKCPFCFKCVALHGGGLTNHLWHSSYCRLKKNRALWALIRKASRTRHITDLDSDYSSPSNESALASAHYPQPVNPQNLFLDTLGIIETPSAEGPTSDTSLQQYQVVQASETAGFVFPGHQRTLWQRMNDQEQAGQPYAPWNSKAEWELVCWLSSTQLSRSNIDNFLKLHWASASSHPLINY